MGGLVLGLIAIAGIVYVLETPRVHEVARETPDARAVLLASFPKSGSNWARFLVGHLQTESQLDFARAEAVVPDLEFGPNRMHFAAAHDASHFLNNKYRSSNRVASSFAEMHERRVAASKWPAAWKSHQPWLDPRKHSVVAGPAELAALGYPRCSGAADAPLVNVEAAQCLCPNCPARWRRVLLVVRDGRSALCSYFQFQKQLGKGGDATFADFLDSPASKYGLSWAAHARSYLDAPNVSLTLPWLDDAPAHRPSATARQQRDHTDIFVLRYEDAHGAPLHTLRKLAQWLLDDDAAALPDTVDADFLQSVLERSSFETMRAAEDESGTPLFDALYPTARQKHDFHLVRQGKVDGWRECVHNEAEADALFEKKDPGFKDTMRRLGY